MRVMDWIVRKGVVRIPDGVSFEQASFIEPVNTCMKGIETLALGAGRDGSGNRAGADWHHFGGSGPAVRGAGNYFRFVSGEAYNS